MTQDTEPDMALAALLAAAKNIGANIPEHLLRKAYEIQRSHQFDRADHREGSLQEMQQLIEKFLDAGGAAE